MNGLEKIAVTISAALADNIIKQGHNDTGALVKSIEHNISTVGTKTTIEILFNDYGTFVNYGRAAGKYVPFSILFDWVKRRLNLSGLQARSATFAINRKIFKEGIPTSGAKKFSKNGKRTGFITDAITDTEKTIEAEIADYYEKVISTKFETVTKVGKYQF